MNPANDIAARLDAIERRYLRIESALSWSTRLIPIIGGLSIVAMVVFGVGTPAYLFVITALLLVSVRVLLRSLLGMTAQQSNDLLYSEIGRDMHWGCEHDTHPDGSQLVVCSRRDETTTWTEVRTVHGANYYRIRETSL